MPYWGLEGLKIAPSQIKFDLQRTLDTSCIGNTQILKSYPCVPVARPFSEDNGNGAVTFFFNLYFRFYSETHVLVCVADPRSATEERKKT